MKKHQSEAKSTSTIVGPASTGYLYVIRSVRLYEVNKARKAVMLKSAINARNRLYIKGTDCKGSPHAFPSLLSITSFPSFSLR